MRYQVRLTFKAERDIENVLRWFAEEHSSAAGAQWLSSLMARLNTLESDPARLPLAEESDDAGGEIRELHFGKRRGIYRLLFRIQGKTVYILRIWHSARQSPTPEDLEF